MTLTIDHATPEWVRFGIDTDIPGRTRYAYRAGLAAAAYRYERGTPHPRGFDLGAADVTELLDAIRDAARKALT